VLLNVLASGAKRLNIFIPDFTIVAGADAGRLGRHLPEVVGSDLRFSALFNVVTGSPALPAGNPDAVRSAWTDAAASGAHAALHTLLTLRGDRAQAEVRLYDLTSPEQRAITTRRIDMPVADGAAARPQDRRRGRPPVHREAGIADTKIAFCVEPDWSQGDPRHGL
jgi:hypothetical protein